MSDMDGSWSDEERHRALDFCKDFLNAPPAKRYVFGRNVYAKAIADQLEIAAFVDDFTDLTSSDGVPVVRLSEVPVDALVLAASGGKPLHVARLLDAKQLRNLDYFAFYKWSGLSLPEAVFNEGFADSFSANREAATWVHDRLADELSRHTLEKLFAFRNSYNSRYLHGFEDREKLQYFEDFVKFNCANPIFVDVGCFDGYTSQEFIKRAPDYRHIYAFEPEASNRAVCQRSLAQFENISILPYGAGKADETLRFSQAGSASSIDPNGMLEIEVRRIDSLINENPSFIKMDIEGAELDAIAGARETIRRAKPSMAICVYHRPSDFWNIPRAVLDLVPDYRVYLRHYTESIYETVMYFVHPSEDT